MLLFTMPRIKVIIKKQDHNYHVSVIGRKYSVMEKNKGFINNIFLVLDPGHQVD